MAIDYVRAKSGTTHAKHDDEVSTPHLPTNSQGEKIAKTACGRNVVVQSTGYSAYKSIVDCGRCRGTKTYTETG